MKSLDENPALSSNVLTQEQTPYARVGEARIVYWVDCKRILGKDINKNTCLFGDGDIQQLIAVRFPVAIKWDFLFNWIEEISGLLVKYPLDLVLDLASQFYSADIELLVCSPDGEKIFCHNS